MNDTFEPTDRESGILLLTADIVQVYLHTAAIPADRAADLIPALIRGVRDALSSDGVAATFAEPETVEKPTAAQIRKSVTDEGLISFIDGKSYKTLKRHLTAHGLDPRGYRERYGLPADYPMVAPAYAAQRSALAKRIGLGRPGAMAESSTTQSLAA